MFNSKVFIWGFSYSNFLGVIWSLQLLIILLKLKRTHSVQVSLIIRESKSRSVENIRRRHLRYAVHCNLAAYLWLPGWWECKVGSWPWIQPQDIHHKWIHPQAVYIQWIFGNPGYFMYRNFPTRRRCSSRNSILFKEERSLQRVS